jgi:hypothetical protein
VTALRTINDVVAFVVEFAALAALVVSARAWGPNLAARIGLAVGAVAVFVVVWGLWLAPRADQRLEMPWLLVAKVVVLGLPFIALALTGHPVPAAVCGGLTAAHLAVAAANGWL